MAVASLKRQLSRFEIRDVRGLSDQDKKEEGAGSYGSVYEVSIRGVPRIAKQLHGVLIGPDVRPDQKQGIYERFYKECLLLSGLDHPNIVKFVGVHFGSSRKEFDASLIMERLHTDLEKYLDPKLRPNVPIPQKLSILFDVSSGLVYLHDQNPSIIHRDLTTGNILLTKDLQAKIADLGVSRVLDVSPNVLAAQTKCPGTLAYMPPEALQERPVYGKALDVFSFGEVCLCTIHQKFAEVYDVTNRPEMPAAHRQGELEILKRKKWFDTMPADHCLCRLTTSCLRDKPEERPTTKQVNEKMKELCIGNWKATIANPHSAEELEVLTAEKKSLEDEVGRVRANCSALQIEHEKMRTQLETTLADSSRLQDDVIAKTQQVKQYKKQTDSYKLRVEENEKRLQSTIADSDLYKGKLDTTATKLRGYQQRIEYFQDQFKSMQLGISDDLAQLDSSTAGNTASAVKQQPYRAISSEYVKMPPVEYAKMPPGFPVENVKMPQYQPPGFPVEKRSQYQPAGLQYNPPSGSPVENVKRPQFQQFHHQYDHHHPGNLPTVSSPHQLPRSLSDTAPPPVPPRQPLPRALRYSVHEGPESFANYSSFPNLICPICGKNFKIGERHAFELHAEKCPFDPNLVCPMCNKNFMIGEIQSYRHHVKTCNG